MANGKRGGEGEEVAIASVGIYELAVPSLSLPLSSLPPPLVCVVLPFVSFLLLENIREGTQSVK